MKTISVIGTGNMGKALAKSFAEQGHRVLLGSRDEDRAKQLAKDLGSNIEGVGNLEAARGGEVVVLAVPFQTDNPVLQELRAELKGKVVIDISNPLNETYSGLTTPSDTSSLEEIASQLPESSVVGAFKNTFPAVLGAPQFAHDQKTTVFVSGNDEQAKSTVINLINGLGFEALDVGGAERSRTVEQMTVLLIGAALKYDNWKVGYQILR